MEDTTRDDVTIALTPVQLVAAIALLALIVVLLKRRRRSSHDGD